MSVIRKIAVSVAALFLGLSAMFLTVGTASADAPWNKPLPSQLAN
ncbi:hypothetical protein [Actinophytocola sp.]